MPKIREFQEILQKRNIDLFISVNIDFTRFSYDMSYFSGYNGVGALVIPKKKRAFLVVSRMENKRAGLSRLKVFSPKKSKKLFEFAKEKVKEGGVKWKRIGVNKEDVSLLVRDSLKKSFKGARLVDLRKELYELREQKTDEEIEIIKEGCRISDEILNLCFSNFKKFKTESDVKTFLEIETKKRNCELAFPTIVASGRHSTMAHHDTTNTKLGKGFCIIDFGIRHKNYCTDTTRTVYLGKPSKKERGMYELVLKVQEEAIKRVKLNLRCSELFSGVKKGLGKYARFFTHGLGHGFGIKVHEFPDLIEKTDHRVREGAVFTIEPGVYLKDFGIRIEDDILVLGGKTRVLTRVRKDLLRVR
jgi:Xaa-Pro aminopeptidase